MSFFYSKPKCTNGLTSVGDVVSQLAAFSAVYEAGKNGSVNNCDLDDTQKANWRNLVRDGVINCGGEATEIDFFQQVFDATSEQIDASTYYIKYNCDKDYNIFAQDLVTGSAPGAATQFQVLRGIHGGGGSTSNVAVGGNIFIYEDRQWVRVSAIDKTTPYAHLVTVIPFSGAYTVNIRKGKKMMFNPVRFVDGYSCNLVNSTWDLPGYINKIKPMILRKDWELPLVLDAAKEDTFQFALSFDREGKEVDSFEAINKTRAREELIYMKNLAFFLGQKIDNPLLVGATVNEKYTGFDGYLPTMRYGGGTVYDYDPSIGFDLEADFQPIILRQDSLKKCKEFMVINGLQFMFGLVRRANQMLKEAPGQTTLEAFTRMGMAKADIEKLGVMSYTYGNYKLHFKEMSALSDTRGIGNYDMPYTAMMIPMTMQKDSKGRSVKAVEFYTPRGFGYSEIDRDHRYLENGCNKLSGTLTETVMMGIHCPQNHILLNAANF